MSLLYKGINRVQQRFSRNDLQKLLLEINKDEKKIIQRDNKLNLLEYGIQIHENDAFLISNYETLSRLFSLGAKLRYDADKVLLEIVNSKIHITTSEELFIAKEVFVDNLYNFNIPGNDVVVFDVGMNVGMASIFFAQKPNVIKVVGYEPFPETFEAAIFNITNNGLSEKVLMHNYGLGKENREVKVKYSSDHKGRMGVLGIGHIPGEFSNVKDERIQIRNATRSIIDQMDEVNRKYLLKLDVEGSEYHIIQDLYENNILERFSVIIIEWHIKGPKELLERLNNAGFSSFSFGSYREKSGMIYAVK